MSGHSHFKTIKAQKELADAKRGKVFSKIARLITIATKEGGKDSSQNPKLKAAMEQARQFNMPKENIERAVKKGSGELTGENLEEISLEGFGPGGFSLIIEGITDNKNRTIGEVKNILSQNQGKMAEEGAVRWMFERKGCITISQDSRSSEELELIAIEVGAQDIIRQGEQLNIYTKPEDSEKAKKALEDKNLKIESYSLEWIPKEEIPVNEKDKELAQKLFEALDENDAIQDIYHNIKL